MKELKLRPDVGVPIVDEVPHVDIRERLDAQVQVIELLTDYGLDIDITEADVRAANDLVAAFAEDPQRVSEAASHDKMSLLSYPTILMVRELLDEFGSTIVHNASNIRNLVVNKLVLETNNADPRIRIRALELLGKMSDVALFTERSEVTVTHQSTDDLRAKLKGKLIKLRESSILTKPDADGVYSPVLDPHRALEEVGLDE